MTTWIYRQDQEFPSFAVAWSDRDGNLIDFSSTDYTFEVKLVDRAGAVAVTKTSGIVGNNTSPNVVVAWAATELDITAGTYRLHLTATINGQDRMFKPGDEPTITIVGKV